MSCNGCRILRRGCNDDCILRQSLECIEASTQSNATLFVAKFFGRAALLSFLSSVPPSQRPALFHSLLLEACGRTLNPVTGAVGLLWTGNWHLCQSAADTVLRGGVLRSLDEANNNALYYDNASRDLNNMVDHGGFHVNQKKTPSDESQTTTLESVFPSNQHLQHKRHGHHHETKLLQLFS